MAQKAEGAETNETKSSLVKAVLKDEHGGWKCPEEDAVFTIDADAKFPEIKFELDTDSSQECEWAWEINWAAATSGLRESKKRGRTLKTWRAQGKAKAETKTPTWVADLEGTCLGGTLVVTAWVGEKKFKRSVRIVGENPTESQVRDYINTFEGIPGFDRIVAQESKYKHFINADGEPVVAFDGGYGLTQMTNPAPSYVEAWDWKANIRAGVKLYREKRKASQAYLSGGAKKKLPFTEEQLQLETWCRWNSGFYHKWDAKLGKWMRDPDILADNKTGNIGWNTTLQENKGKTEEELHQRDQQGYAKKTSNSLWTYSGVVYADHIKEN
jgi:hypothetical protein